MTAAEVLASAAATLGAAALRWTPVLALAVLAARRRGASAARRHSAWAAALVALALMVPAGEWLPGWDLPLPARAVELASRPVAPGAALAVDAIAADAGAAGTGEGVRAGAAAAPAAGRWLGLVWLLGAAALAGGEIRRLDATRRLMRSARPLPAEGAGAAWECGALRERCRAADLAVPAVAGVTRPRILLPARWPSWPRRWREAVLLHEAAHLERRDLAWQLLARWLRIAFWFHPGVWLAARAVEREAEAACDDRVVAGGIDRLDYARVLVEVAATVRSAPALGAALGAVPRRSHLGARVRRLVGPAPRASRGRSLGAVALVACGVAAAAARPSAEPNAVRRGELPLRRVAGADGARATWLLRCAPSDERCAGLGRSALESLRASAAPGVAVVVGLPDGRVEAYVAHRVESGGAPGVPSALPGSIAKLALAAAWWERGLGDRPLPCPPSIRTSAGGHVEAHGSGSDRLAPREVLALSCNTAAAAMAARLGERAGLRALTGALEPLLGDTPAANAGAVDWELQAIGVGPLETDPLRVAAFLLAIGNEGVAVEPWAGAAPAVAPRRLFSPATASALRAALAETVARGTAARLGELQSGQPWRLTGKTGTVRLPDGRVDGWFAGLVNGPAGRPERVVVVWLEGGGPGAGNPARLALELARAARG